MSHKRLFLSMVSDEFRSYRELLCSDLERGQVDITTQEKFGNLGETTLEKLDHYMQKCDAVIHLVGDGLGHVPPTAAVTALLERHDKFLEKLGEHTDLTREILDGCSYTQWEAYLAIFHKVRLHIYRPDEKAPREKDFVATDDEKVLQEAHFDRIRALGRDRDVFLNEERLSSFVLADLNDILPSRDSAATIAIPRLPHSPRELIGREPWLAKLDEAWRETHQHVVVVRAWGGVGKTSLATAWMAEMEFKGWRRAERVFYWSFYSQGTRREGESAASADTFIAKALAFFGDDDPTAGSAWDRGARLAGLIGSAKNLLVLDGVEPLQHPPGPMAGQLTDPALESLLSGLAAQSEGLCVVTTRENVVNLDGRLTVKTWALDKLSDEAGAALLHKNGVNRAGDAGIEADDCELIAACDEVDGHALTLTLMGKYLALACGGDIRQRDTFAFADADPEWVTTFDKDSPYGHAFKVIAAYERWFLGEAAERTDNERREGRLQLGILRLLGLFNRPASIECLFELRKGEAIIGLTEDLKCATRRDWNIAVSRLEAANLVKRDPPTGDNFSLDAHPLVREYFGQQLRLEQTEAFQEAHSRLFDHLCESIEHQPSTLEGLQPLYQAVAHGCFAERQQEACNRVFRDRIQRGTLGYSVRKFGAIGSDLGALAAFFEQPWNRLSPNLSKPAQAWLLNESAFRLRALGRLTEALEPMRISLGMCEKMKDWREASVRAGNLSELEGTLGRLDVSVADARRAIVLADSCDDLFQQSLRHANAANALHQRGKLDEARMLFEGAEAIQRKHQPQFNLLYSLCGFQYCDLILIPAERSCGVQLQECGQEAVTSVALVKAENRAKQTLKWVTIGTHDILSVAFDHLTLARVALFRALLRSSQADTNYQNPHLRPALDGLRESGHIDHLPKGLLTAAWHYHFTGDPDTARRHLDEAQQIAERGPMPLYLADVHLHRARLFRDTSELTLAAELIHKHHYGRRYEELADAEAASVDW